MKELKLFSIQRIQMTFQYLSQCVTLNCELYKTLKEIKIKAINKMIDVPIYAYCSYLGVNLSTDENKKIGDIFTHKEKVLIKLKLPNIIPVTKYNNRAKSRQTKLNELRNFNSISKENNSTTFFSSNNTNLTNNINIFSPKLEMPIKLMKKPKKIRIINRVSAANKFIKILSSKNSKSPDIMFSKNMLKEKSLPPLQNTSEIQTPIYKKFEKLCICKKYPISEYCRTCGKFICNECRISDKHKGHLNIHLNMINLKQNILSYAKILQNDIMGTLELNKNIKYNSVDESMNYSSQKEIIDEKYEQAIDKYFEVINIINNYISKLDKERTKLQIDTYNKNSLKIQKEIIELMEKFKNNKNKEVNLNYLDYFFKEINSREEMLLFLQKDILKYHLANEINIKMNSSMKKIEKILNEINNNKNPFNLNDKYRNEFSIMKIIKSDIEKESINDKNQ